MIRIRAKTINGEPWQPKTKVNRAVPISAALRGYLDKYTPRTTAGGSYFPSLGGHGGTPDRWDCDNFSADLRAANADAGLQWSCLDYRHTFGTQLAQARISLFKIATLIANSPEICRRHYAASVPGALGSDGDFTPRYSLHANTTCRQ